jgi:deferrochelatase/peroxidase EfeB
MQTALARMDGLMEYLQHTGSGLYAVPPGVPSVRPDGTLVDDGFTGAALFA